MINMKSYNGVPLLDTDFKVLKVIESLVGEPIYFTQFYQDNGIDEVGIFNAYFAENGQIINLMLILPVFEIPKEITELKALKTLFIKGNGKTTLPKSLESLVSLKDLSLEDFNLEMIPESIGYLEHLEILRFCNFDNINFPKTIKKLKSLRIFGLYESVLKNIPEFVLEIECLNEFDMWSSQLKKSSEATNILDLLQKKGIKVKKPKWI